MANYMQEYLIMPVKVYNLKNQHGISLEYVSTNQEGLHRIHLGKF